MTESELESKAGVLAESLGITHYKLSGNQRKGKADHIFIYQGRCCLIEFKSGFHLPPAKQNQITRRDKLRREGTPSIITASWHMTYLMLTGLKSDENILKLTDNYYDT